MRMRPMMSIPMADAAAPGKSAIPVSNAVIPSAFCKKSGKIKFEPNRPKPMTTPTTFPIQNCRMRKTSKSTNG